MLTPMPGMLAQLRRLKLQHDHFGRATGTRRARSCAALDVPWSELVALRALIMTQAHPLHGASCVNGALAATWDTAAKFATAACIAPLRTLDVSPN